MKPINTLFLGVLTFCEQLLTFFQEERKVIGDARPRGTVDESSSEQQICGTVYWETLTKGKFDEFGEFGSIAKLKLFHINSFLK